MRADRRKCFRYSNSATLWLQELQRQLHVEKTSRATKQACERVTNSCSGRERSAARSDVMTKVKTCLRNLVSGTPKKKKKRGSRKQRGRLQQPVTSERGGRLQKGGQKHTLATGCVLLPQQLIREQRKNQEYIYIFFSWLGEFPVTSSAHRNVTRK